MTNYILECTYFNDSRNVDLPRNLVSTPSMNVFHNIVNASGTQTVFKVVKYCNIILKSFKVIVRNI